MFRFISKLRQKVGVFVVKRTKNNKQQQRIECAETFRKYFSDETMRQKYDSRAIHIETGESPPHLVVIIVTNSS